MYLKLALKNMKQSTKDYLIYMITLVLSVAMFYGFFSIASPYYSNMLQTILPFHTEGSSLYLQQKMLLLKVVSDNTCLE